jgi:hypothetical protein
MMGHPGLLIQDYVAGIPIWYNPNRQKGNIYKRTIAFYDEMGFILRDKHATGEFKVLQAPNAS